MACSKIWVQTAISPEQVDFQLGDVLATWSDGGFDFTHGGTAGYIIAVWRDSRWQCLQYGGVYDKNVVGNDSFRMEAIGMELLLSSMREYTHRGT